MLRTCWWLSAAVIALSGCAVEAGPKLSSNSSASELASLASLRGNTRNAIAWAPLADPEDVSVEGSVPSSRAWSTSKVLVIAAYLDVVAGGNPDRVPATTRASIRAALTRSDDSSIKAVHSQTPNARAAMTHVLRAIGDTTTIPEFYEGATQWSVREQVRFMAALANGQVVSPQASSYLIHEMQPIESQRWGLGTIGAQAFKPGWMGPQTESRQMGIVGDFAVAIITSGEESTGTAGDPTHSAQLNRIAQLLAVRIEDARCVRSDVLEWEARWCFGIPF